MDELLHKAALIELEKAQRKLLAGGDVKVKSSVSWLKKSLAWCDEYGIRLGREAGVFFYIEQQGIDAVEQRLSLLKQGTLKAHADVLPGTRDATISVTSNEKLAAKLPTEHLVLSACLDLPLRLSHQSCFNFTETPPQINIELDIHTIDLSRYDYLIVVENRDSFNQWHRYKVSLDITRPLVVYRGHDKYHSKACAGLKSRWLQEKGAAGQVYFGDFDVHGIGIAVDAKVAYQHLLLPEIQWLKQHLIQLHYRQSQTYDERFFSQRCPIAWQSILSLIFDSQAALRQQWMFNTPLELH
ncbi:hypothetical protein ACMAZF_03315 [Psychrobium sp. nBUS_13]|uniref:DUF7281 domain-containing protein n=1 Tax=Psychrobium sp. nBUS_13 TaxID=3395319 RepID=UPI003EB90408